MSGIEALRPLSDEERIEAREMARENVIRAIGKRPSREQYKDANIGEYPAWVNVAGGILLTVVLFAAATVSAFRLYAAGKEHFLESIPDPDRAMLVGVATFLLAEFMVLSAALSARVFFRGKEQLLLLPPIAVGLAVALAGNWTITRPDTLWGWLDTVAPPIALLSVAIIGEKLILQAVKRRHENERAYQQALAEWKAATANPEQSPRWRAAYANALRDKLREANSRGPGRTARMEVMQAMSLAEWRQLVAREMAAEDWFDGAASPSPLSVGHSVAPTAAPLQRWSGNGHRVERVTIEG